MGTCAYCDLLQGESVLYEDALTALVMPSKPAVPGHLIVIPKQHSPILEEFSDEIASHCFLVANKTSSLIFEAMGAAGTNIIVQNGLTAGQTVPHMSIHVLPRQKEDGLSFRWPPQKIPDQKMTETQQALKDECDYFGQTVAEKKPEPKKEDKKVEYTEDNYLIKQLRRIP